MNLIAYRGALLAGGLFQLQTPSGIAHNIASWNGSTWQPLASDVNLAVQCFAEYDGKLIAGGSFSVAGGQPVNQIASWDGASWKALGSGLMGVGGAIVAELTVYDGELIAGGYFDSAGGIPVNNIARWNGWYWQPLGAGTEFVSCFTQLKGQLIVGGSFDTAGGKPADNVAAWTGCDNPPPTPCPADITGSGNVNVLDLQAVLSDWNHTGPDWADADDNGIVDIDDLLAVINGWGECP